MVNEKGKRKLEFQGESYYWYVKKDMNGIPKIHIISADKKLQLKYYFDKEMIISPAYIKETLQRYFDNTVE